MNNLKIFENNDFGSIRTVNVNNEPYFVGRDVAVALGYTNPSKAIGDHCKGVTKRYPLATSGGIQDVRIISEPDLLRLIVNSKLPSAVRFEAWVFEEVLPSIRKHGGYIAVSENETDDEIIFKAMNLLQVRLSEREKELQTANETIKEQQPAVLFANAVKESDSSIYLKDLATILKQNGFNIGQNRLFVWMRENGFLCSSKQYWNKPTQRALDSGLFEVKQALITKPNGETKPTFTPFVTGKGQVYFVNRFLKE